MDVATLVEIVVAIVIAYFLIKFIVSPIIKIAIGIISILIMIFLLQRFFGFNIDEVLSKFGISLNLNKWGSDFNWILSPLFYFVDKIKDFFTGILGNLPKK